MNWPWWVVPLIVGTVMLLGVVDYLRNIRNSLRNIEELLERAFKSGWMRMP